MPLMLRRLPGEYAVCRLPGDAGEPAWASGDGFVSITRAPDELSVVCPAARIPAGIRSTAGWTLLQFRGPFPFELTGILASVASPLAEAEVPIFALSTHDTDYLLVPLAHWPRAAVALRAAGHDVRE